MAEKTTTLILSEIAGELGETVSATSTAEELQSLILSKLPRYLTGDALKLSKENRELKIKSLVGTKITPAVANKLIQRFASTDTLILSATPGVTDGFAEVMDVLGGLPDLNLNLSEKTRSQLPSEPQTESRTETKSHLQKIAEKRLATA